MANKAVRPEDIKYVTVDDAVKGKGRTLLLEGEIPGASVYYHTLPAGEQFRSDADSGIFRIFFLLKGEVTFASSETEVTYAEKAVYTDVPTAEVTISAKADATYLEICWEMDAADLKELNARMSSFPLTERYADTVQYRDFFKSETTISRQIVKQSIIPRFAFGSVEAKADDLVGMHAHPLLDQFFFSFEDNDMDILVDCRICPMKGNTLLHIPLASNHGVIARGNQKMHYLWLDFIPQENRVSAVEYLDETHTETGVKQEL